MNVERLQSALIAAAKNPAPSREVPAFFVKRVMARLGPGKPVLRHWSSDLWRAALTCSALALVVAGWTLLSSDSSGTDWSQEFEHTVIVAAVAQESEQGW